MLTNDQNLNRGTFLFQNLGCFQATHGWHGDIEEHDIGLVLLYFIDGINAVNRLADNFDISLGTKHLADAATNALTVVYDEHTKCAFRHAISQGRDSLSD